MQQSIKHSNSNQTKPSNKKHAGWVVLLLITAITWSSSLTSEFTGYDDIKLIVENPHAHQGLMHSLKFFWDTFSGSFNTAWSDFPTIIYRPLEQYGIALGYKLWGTNPWFYHFFYNYSLHIANSILIFLILRKFIKEELIVLCICGIWAVHPLHHEAVNMLTSGPGFLLAHTLALSSILINLYSSNWKHILLASTLFFAALLGSEMIVLLIPILAILLYKKEAYWFKINALIIALVIYLVKRASIVSSNVEMSNFELIERIFVLAPQTLVNYFKEYFYPVNLSIDLQHNLIITNAFTPFHFASLLLVLVIIGLIIFFYNRGDKELAASLAISIIAISLALNIMPLYSLARDRYTYIFSLALTVFLVLLAQKRLSQRNIIIGSSILVVILGTRSFIKNFDWQNGERLWMQTINSVNDIGAKQVWRYRLLQYYQNPGTKTFKADPQLKTQTIKDFANFISQNQLNLKKQIFNYDSKIHSVKNTYSYNEGRSIASGIFSYAMFLKHSKRYKEMRPLLELAFYYHPEHFQNNLQLFVWLEPYKEKVIDKLYRDALSHPIFAKSLLDSLYILKDKRYREYALQIAAVYPNSAIFKQHLKQSEGFESAN